MKHRDIFRVPARLERRSKPETVWKDSNGFEKHIQSQDLGWFIIVKLADAEFAFSYGEIKPAFSTPTINLILEYTVPDAQS